MRNYLTQKPYSVEKFKLNFKNTTLAGGWDENKETDNTCVILLKDEKYFLAVMDKVHNKVFEKYKYNDTENIYQKMNYKLLPGANKMLPKVFFSQKGLKNFRPPQEILDLYKNEEHKKGNTFNLESCHKLINFFKDSIQKHEDWKKFNFDFEDTKNCDDLSGFYREVEQQGYKITFENIAEDYINKMVEEEKLYLFEIYSKDFSTKKNERKGTDNLHTIFWKALFEEENLKNVVYKLNGQAELFFRKASIKYSEKKRKEGHHYEDLRNKFNYPILKDKRYSEDKILFHCPITCNFKAQGNNYLNQKVNEFLKDKKDVNIIGIDRGERNLLYYSVINQDGDILEQGSWNIIKNEYEKEGEKITKEIDYHAKLDIKEKERAGARENWETIENIKELKAGYLSQVVHQLSELIVKHNAIVVLEDLNFGFKRGRFKVEKQIYQNLKKP